MNERESTATTNSTIPNGWPALFAAITADVPDNTAQVRGHIDEAMRLLRRISTHLRAYSVDDLDEPNLADIAIEDLAMALEKLS